MHKTGRIGLWFFLILMFLFQLTSQAQSKKYFVITGKIEPESGEAVSGSIEVQVNGKPAPSIEIPKNRRFRLELEFFKDYILTFKFPGHFNKIITVSTEIPQEVWARDNDFPPFPMVVSLLKEYEGIDKSFTLKPSGRIFYGKEIDNFEKESLFSDIQFSEQIETAKSKANQVQKEAQSISKVDAEDLAAKQKQFDQMIKDADALYQRGEYQLALLKYLDAHQLFPDKAYANDRIAELQDLVKALEITNKQKADLEQKYKESIAKANGFFDQKNYTNARPGYEQALQYKPGDVFASGRISEIDQLLALQEKQKQYNDLIVKADNNFKAKNYDQAIATYNQAMQIVPANVYPKNQIDLITAEKQQQAKLEQIETEFNKNLQVADKKSQQKEFTQAIDAYKKAIELKPDSKLAKDKLAEAEQAMIAFDTDTKYQQAVQLADQALAANDLQKAKMQFQEALKLKTGESYPKNKLSEIEKTEANEINFNGLVSKAEKAFSANNFDESYSLFSKALELKPKNVTVQKRIDEIDGLKKQQVAEKEYTDLIAQADQSFQNNQMDASLSAYNKALSMKKAETYPKAQIQKIENYLALIKKADKSFESKDYTSSLNNLTEALSQKPNDSYARDKVSEINTLLAEKKKQEEKALADQNMYVESVKKADDLLAAGNYTGSIEKYKEAANLKAAEIYPKKKIKEVEDILDQLAKDKVKKDKEFLTIIAQADRFLEKKDYSNAQAEYKKAMALKSEEVYPKDQIKKIDDTLAEIKRQHEEENQRMLNEKANQEYAKAMAAADKAFSSNDLETAKTGYQTALTIKQNDLIAKEKYGQAEAKLAQIARMTQAYNTAITEANKQLTDKKYKEAKEKYQESLQYLPDSDYPKRQIAKIDEVLTQQEAEAKTKQDFAQAVAEGETLLKNKELEKAKDSFNKAYKLIPSEVIPPQRIKEINDLIAEQTRKDAEQKTTLAAYQDAIKRADKLFGNKDYNSARLVYQEAIQIKSDEKYPVDQQALIDKLIIEQNELQYQTAIKKGDNTFNANQFDDATAAYTEALKYKENDKYASQRLKDIEAKKAEIEAEKNRLKSLKTQYNETIADAANDFKNKEYLKAKDKYQKALTLFPNEVLPKEQIARIDQILSDLQKEEELNKQYVQQIKLAELAFSQNKLQEAREDYQKANILKPAEPLPPTRIAEINKLLDQLAENARLAAQEEAQRLAKEKADREKYNTAVAAGDKLFSGKQYTEARLKYLAALNVLPDENYPRDQIRKIDELFAQVEKDRMLALKKSQQDSIKSVRARAFELAMNSAKENEQSKHYQEAIQNYEKAIQIDPSQRTVVEKLIKENEDRLQIIAKQELEYKRVIKIADSFYAESKLDEALVQYRNAVTIKSDEEYPKKQINAIQAVLNQRDESYTNAIKKADKAFDSSDWQNAKTGYTEALVIKPNEAYPTNRLKEVNQKIAEANLAAMAKPAEDKAYNEAIEKAERALKEDQLSTAKMQFEVAKSLKPDEKIPVEKIKEIDELIDQRSKERLAQEQREIDEKYRQAISLADNSFREKTYAVAKLQYKQASLIKPDESYPKTQMNLIDKLMNEAKPVETYAYQLPAIETVIQDRPKFNSDESAQATEARAKNYTTTDNYDEAVKKADDSFGIKDYAVARFYYTRANEIKSAEEYPKKQLEIIRKIIDANMSGDDISRYNEMIGKADAAFTKTEYSIAKFFYYKALEIKSWEKYPKDRINEILGLTNSLLSEREEKEYRDLITKGDQAYVSKDISIARFYYNKALSMKKDEDYPRIKLKDIQKLIEQEKQDQGKLEYQKLIDLADQAMQFENFSIARFNYNKALSIKPDEKYPKDQLKRIKEALDKPKK